MSTLIRVDDGAIARIRGRRSPGADRVAAVVAAQRERGFPDSFAWSRPDRLLLVVPFSDADRVGRVALRVDGQPVPIERFVVAPPGDLRLSGEPLPGRLPATTVCWWADLTDVLGEGRDNRLELSIDGIAANQFLGPWLEAPGSRWDLEAPGVRSVADDEPAGSASTGWSGATPSGGLAVPRIVDEGMPPAPRVVRAWLEPAVLRAGIPATIRAEVDADDREVSGVFCSTLVGPGVFTDVALHPLGDRTWSHTFLVGGRREVILDPAASRVWAVTRDGQPTPPMVIPMRWALEPRRADMSGATGARRRDG